MPEEQDPKIVLSVLMNEQFILQSASGITVSESGSRAALYLSAFSSGLVAIGFASSSETLLATLAFTVLPTVFVLGCFTTNRLIDTTAENIIAQGRIRMIRAFYAKLDPTLGQFFPLDETQVFSRTVRYTMWSIFFTMASMIILVNGVLGGAVVALVLAIGLHSSLPVAVAAGIAAGVILVAVGLGFQQHRIGPLIRDPSAGAFLNASPETDVTV